MRKNFTDVPDLPGQNFEHEGGEDREEPEDSFTLWRGAAFLIFRLVRTRDSAARGSV